MMDQKTTWTPMAPAEFAHLGEGQVAYVRELRSDEIPALLPAGAAVQDGLRLWALINAAGAPILVADSREVAVAGALQNDLTTVSVH